MNQSETGKFTAKKNDPIKLLEFPLKNFQNLIKESKLYSGFIDPILNLIYLNFTINLQKDKSQFSIIIEYKNFLPIKYFFSTSLVTDFIKINPNYIIAGTKEGSLNIWDCTETNSFHFKENKFNNRFQTNFEDLIIRFPSFSTEYSKELEHLSPVKKIVENCDKKLVKEFFSIEEFGNIILWNIHQLTIGEVQRIFIDYGINTKIKIIKTLQINQNSQSISFEDNIFYNLAFDIKDNLLNSFFFSL